MKELLVEERESVGPVVVLGVGFEESVVCEDVWAGELSEDERCVA